MFKYKIRMLIQENISVSAREYVQGGPRLWPTGSLKSDCLVSNPLSGKWRPFLSYHLTGGQHRASSRGFCSCILAGLTFEIKSVMFLARISKRQNFSENTASSIALPQALLSKRERNAGKWGREKTFKSKVTGLSSKICGGSDFGVEVMYFSNIIITF